MNVEPIPEKDLEEQIESEKDNRPSNDHVMLKCTSGSDKIIPLMNASGDVIQGGKLVTATDINIGEEGFTQCSTPPDENIKCKPTIENQQWQCTDEKHTSNTCDAVTCDSFMFCLHGYGIIYIQRWIARR